jgi:hypothetical protein
MQSIRTPEVLLSAAESRSFAQFGGMLGWYSQPTELPQGTRRISPSRLPLCIRTCVDLKKVVHIHKLRCGDRPHYYFTDTDGDIHHMA